MPPSFTVRPPRPGGWQAPSQRMFADDDDDHDDGFGAAPAAAPRRRDERIDGFANGRQVGEKGPAPMVIAPAPNRDWRDVTRKAPSYRPEARREEIVTHEREEVVHRAGIRKMDRTATEVEVKTEVTGELNGSSSSTDGGRTVKAEANGQSAEVESTVKTEKKPLTADEEALQALLAGEEEEVAKTTHDLVISHNEEQAALNRDLPDLPDESTLEDYAAVPVEAFGAAILRGMGYDPAKDTKLHVPKPRPALLGIGATSLSSELPPSRKKKQDYATRGGRGYNAAGLLTPRDSAPASRDGSRAVSVARESRDVSELREREREKSSRDVSVSRDRERDRSSREDSLAGTRRRREDDDYGRERKRRERSYETDEERARRKARERERERDRDRDRERDRDRDRGDRRDRDRDDRDRYRDRDRERERDRDRRDRR